MRRTLTIAMLAFLLTAGLASAQPASVWNNSLPIGNIVIGNDITPRTTGISNLGTDTKKFLTLKAWELQVETLIAQNTQATIGGRILVGPTTYLTADITAGATSIATKHNNLSNGDRVILESAGNFEAMAVTSGAGGGGPYTYSVTRNLDGSGANAWYSGDAVFDTGTTGNGFLDLYSVRGVKSAGEVGPTIVGNVRNSATWNDWSPRWACGNLNGLYDIATNIYGCGFGDYAHTWTMIDATNGFRIMYGATPKVTVTPAGVATFVGDGSGVTNIDGGNIQASTITAAKINVAMLSAIVANLGAITAGTVTLDSAGYLRGGQTAYNTGTGFWLGYDGAYKFSIGNGGTGARMTWDGANFNLLSGDLWVDNSGVYAYTYHLTEGGSIYGTPFDPPVLATMHVAATGALYLSATAEGIHLTAGGDTMNIVANTFWSETTANSSLGTTDLPWIYLFLSPPWGGDVMLTWDSTTHRVHYQSLPSTVELSATVAALRAEVAALRALILNGGRQ